MPDPNITRDSSGYLEALKSLEAKVAALPTSPEIDAMKALHGLLEVNEAFTRILEITIARIALDAAQTSVGAIATTSLPDQALVDKLRQSVEVLDLWGRCRATVQRIPVLVFKNDLPHELKRGVSAIGELIQLKPTDFLDCRYCGKKTVHELSELLASHGLEFGTILVTQELEQIGISRIEYAGEACKSGSVDLLRKGNHAKRLGAQDIVNQPVEAIPRLTPEGIKELKRIVLEDDSQKERNLSTIGDLIQVRLDHTGRYFFSDEFELSLLNYLMPRGLCLDMTCSDELLDSLGIKRVYFNRRDRD